MSVSYLHQQNQLDNVEEAREKIREALEAMGVKDVENKIDTAIGQLGGPGAVNAMSDPVVVQNALLEYIVSSDEMVGSLLTGNQKRIGEEAEERRPDARKTPQELALEAQKEQDKKDKKGEEIAEIREAAGKLFGFVRDMSLVGMTVSAAKEDPYMAVAVENNVQKRETPNMPDRSVDGMGLFS